MLAMDLLKIMYREDVISHQMRAEYCLWEDGATKPRTHFFWEIFYVLFKNIPKIFQMKISQDKEKNKNRNLILPLHFVLLSSIPQINMKYSAYY